MSSFPCLVRSVSGSGEVRYALGHRLVDRYPEVPASAELTGHTLPPLVTAGGALARCSTRRSAAPCTKTARRYPGKAGRSSDRESTSSGVHARVRADRLVL